MVEIYTSSPFERNKKFALSDSESELEEVVYD
jgi:hypothetical protein